MKINEAELLFKKADDINGNVDNDFLRKVRAHSRSVAEVAKRIAEAAGMDGEKAYSIGLIHDIGDFFNEKSFRHCLDGYNFLKENGIDEDIAKICLTHMFLLKDGRDFDLTSIHQFANISQEELDFIFKYVAEREFDDYDLLIQLADYMGWATGPCMVEQRIAHVLRRYEKRNVKDFCARIHEIKLHFCNKIGCSVYKIFPEISENIHCEL